MLDQFFQIAITLLEYLRYKRSRDSEREREQLDEVFDGDYNISRIIHGLFIRRNTKTSGIGPWRGSSVGYSIVCDTPRFQI